MDPDHSLLISQIGKFVDYDGFFEEFETTTLDPSKWTVTAGSPTIDNVGTFQVSAILSWFTGMNEPEVAKILMAAKTFSSSIGMVQIG
jgi:hypothetical protein